MGTYLNPGNGRFQDTLNSEIYVDKTGLITFTNRKVSTEQKFICISRPRRFGKSLTANMLVAYYGRGCDSHAQFDGLAVANDVNYEKHINKYNTVRLDISFFIKEDISVKTGLKNIENEVTGELKKEYPEINFEKNSLISVLETIYRETKDKFVFVLDEWDNPFRERKFDKKGQRAYLRYLKELFKDQEYIALAYMTGILPIKKYGTQSFLNMFMEISMTNADPVQEFVGFTEKEVRRLCDEHHKSYDNITKWYNGYLVNGISVFNPNSVVCAMLASGNDFVRYWTSTETFEDLEAYIRTNTFEVQDMLVDLLAGKSVKVRIGTYQNDMVTFKSYNDVFTLLIHLGYLSYDSATKEVTIPNREITECFEESVEDAGLGNLNKTIIDSRNVLDATLRGDGATVAKLVEKIHCTETANVDYNKEVSLKYVIKHAYLAATDYYSIVSEMPAGKGIADVAFIPLTGNPGYPPMVIELKVRGPVNGAMKQILEKKYDDFLPGFEGDMILVGIHYDRKKKTHTCQIMRISK
ncbi:MAG: ATP-binding protein [Clostridia bacterium]|nr:ATP-binding protein [Clostridia bacterium]